MEFLNTITAFTTDNYVTILTLIIIAIISGVAVKKTLHKRNDEKEKTIKNSSYELLDMIDEGILDLVVQAEQKYGEKTGNIKKSFVYNMIVEKYPKVLDYIVDGVIAIQTIDTYIDEAVETINDFIEDNDILKNIFKKQN